MYLKLYFKASFNIESFISVQYYEILFFKQMMFKDVKRQEPKYYGQGLSASRH